MKKTRLLALTSLCSVLAGMPANAGKIKDSDAKKIGGVETQVDKENSNSTNKNEVKGKFDLDYVKRFIKDPKFIKYAKYVLGFMAIEGTHEGLSYFKGNPGQFYEKPAKLSLTGYVRKRKTEKEKAEKKSNMEKFKLGLGEFFKKKAEEYNKIEETKGIIEKIKKLTSDRLFNVRIFDQEKFDSLENPGDCVTQPEKLDDEKLKVAILTNTDLTQEEYNKVKECFDFYICYFKQNLKGIKLVYCLKGHEKELFSAAPKVNSMQTMAEFDNKFTLLSAADM